MFKPKRADIVKKIQEIQRAKDSRLGMYCFGMNMATGEYEQWLVCNNHSGSKTKLQYLGIGNLEIYNNLVKILEA